VLFFLDCLLDNRLMFLAQIPRRLRLANKDSAITTGATDIAYLAVPSALAGNTSFWHERAWLLEPFDPARPPETAADLVPDAEALRLNRGRGVRLQDLYPFLDSDHGDRHWKPTGAWRLRGHTRVFRFREIVPDGRTVKLLRRQRLYGGEPYDWQKVREASTKAFRRM